MTAPAWDAALLIGKTTIVAGGALGATAARLRILRHPVHQAGFTRAPTLLLPRRRVASRKLSTMATTA
jgi:hypothetical protein